MELIFVDRERTTALDHQKLAKDTCIQLLKMIHVHKSGRNVTETSGTRMRNGNYCPMGVVDEFAALSKKITLCGRPALGPLEGLVRQTGTESEQYGFNM